MSKICLTTKQTEAFDIAMDSLLNQGKRFCVISGVAGSGKTEIIKKVVQALSKTNMSVACCALTGRATSVIKNRMMVDVKRIPIGHFQTIHSLIYQPVYDNNNNFCYFEKKESISYDLIVVDEASMITDEIFTDLLSYDVPILFVGDKEQLPPIDSSGFNVMEASDVHLTEIHRQAENNPIIALSRCIRETGKINNKYDNDHIRFIRKSDMTINAIKQMQQDIILTGTNDARHKFNHLVRAAKGFKAIDNVDVGERIVCLKNLYTENHALFNGELFTVFSVVPGESRSRLVIHPIDAPYQKYDIMVNNNSWNDLSPPEKDSKDAQMTYGEAISVWKAQGSQFDHVAFFDEDVSYFCDRKKFRYTAVTRAVNKLTIITN